MSVYPWRDVRSSILSLFLIFTILNYKKALKICIFWDIPPCDPVESQPKLCLPPLFTLFSCLAYLLPWKWRPYISPKRLSTFSWLQDAISQNTEFFITTAGGTSVSVQTSLIDWILESHSGYDEEYCFPDVTSANSYRSSLMSRRNSTRPSSCLLCKTSILYIEEICSSETSLKFYHTASHPRIQ